MTDVKLGWEPDVENYKLEHFSFLGFIPENAYKVAYKRDDLESRGTGVGELYGERRDIYQLKLDALKTLVWKLVKDGRNPLDATFHVNRTLEGSDEFLVFWVL